MKLLNTKTLISFMLIAGLAQSALAATLMLGGMGGKNPTPLQVSVEQTYLQEEPEIVSTFQGAFESRFVAPDKQRYSQLSVPGCGSTAEEVGMPELPFNGFFLEIPYGVDVSVKLLDTTEGSLGEDFLVWPMQESPLDDGSPDPPFEINEEVYNTNSFFPESPVVIEEPGFIRGRRVVFVQVFPLQYNPVSTELRAFSSLRFKLQFRGTPDESGEARKKRLATRTSEALAKFLIKNYKPVELRKSGEIENRSEEIEGGIGFQPLGLSTGSAADYLIIVDDDLHEEILPLAEWKHMKGFITRVVDMSDVGSTASDVEDYIQDAYDQWDPAPSFVLLVGDSGDVPPDWYSGSYSCYTDHAYACVDGGDMYADITMGRLPVHTGAECTNVVNKIIKYDRAPNTGNWYDDFLSAAYFQDDNNNGYANRAYMQTLAYMKDYLANTVGMTSNTAWCTNSGYHATYYYKDGKEVPSAVTDEWLSGASATTAISTAINGGVGLVEHRDHGGITSWSHPSFTNTNISNLSNGEKTSVVFSINCSTGSFQNGAYGTNDCFCEAFLKKSPGGCVGIVGPTRTSPSFPNNELINGINTSFWPSYAPNFAYTAGGTPITPSYDPNDNYYDTSWRLAEALNYGKYHVLGRLGSSDSTTGEFYMYFWFGDPEMMLRTETPASLSVSHPSAVLANTSVNVTVTVTKDSDPLEGALVCISHPTASDHWADVTNASGSVTFSNIEFSQVDDYNVVVTAHDCIPYESIITTKPPIIYVDKDATGSNNGSSWTNAFTDLQDGFGAATAGSEIWVAEGTYKPTADANRAISFELVDGVAIYGGFDGTETSRSQRDWTSNETILSGDIGTASVSDNCYHVVRGEDNAILDGFTITRGYANGDGLDGFGGAIWHNDGALSVCNSTLSENSAQHYGGAIYNSYASCEVSNCVFTDCDAYTGGGMYAIGSSASNTIINCFFTNNSARYGGGALHLDTTPGTIVNCAFTRNKAERRGGALWLEDYEISATVVNSTFYANDSNDEGGGIWLCGDDTTVTNCVFWGNTATIDGGEIYNSVSGAPTFTNCDIQGGLNGSKCGGGDSTDGGGNVDIDPKFEQDGYHLQQPGVATVVNGGTVADYGDKDIDGENRVMRGTVDMGADELDWPCAGLQQDGDADGDGTVEFNTSGSGTDDYDKWWVSYNTSTYNACCDFDRDGDVDWADRTIGINHNCETGSSCTNCQGIW